MLAANPDRRMTSLAGVSPGAGSRSVIMSTSTYATARRGAPAGVPRVARISHNGEDDPVRGFSSDRA